MNVPGTYHKRKSFGKQEPEMPQRKISGNSRQGSKKKHRTQHKSINSPDVQLKAYKRKNLISLSVLQATCDTDEKSSKAHLRIDRSKDQSHIIDESIMQGDRKVGDYSVKEFSQEPSPQRDNQGRNIRRQELTSRFTIGHNDNEQNSLTSLINLAKSNNSNPLINTARLSQQKQQQNDPFALIQLNRKVQLLNYNAYQPGQDYKQDGKLIQQNSNKAFLNNSNYSHQLQRIDESHVQQSEQNQNNQGQNFEDYEFGGQNSNDFQQDQSIAQSSICKSKKNKNTLLPPSKVKLFTANDVIEKKPQNWRQMNRYIPQSEQEHRMNQQVLKKQKASLQIRRQQQQIFSFIKSYQQNKNSMHLVSQRKVQTNKIIQKVYRDKRINPENKNSLSLPQLKHHSQPKKLMVIPDVNSVHAQMNDGAIPMIGDASTMNPIQVKSKIRGSLSYSKLGFGSSKPRLLNDEEMNQSQLESIGRIQKKLRQKGVQFNTTSIRKGLLNLHETPLYKLSIKNVTKTESSQIADPKKLDLPSRQLPSNGFYKIFPL